MNKAVAVPEQLDLSRASLQERAGGRLREIEAFVLAIEEGELLATTPADAAARRRHEAAVALLAVMHRELLGLIEDLE